MQLILAYILSNKVTIFLLIRIKVLHFLKIEVKESVETMDMQFTGVKKCTPHIHFQTM